MSEREKPHKNPNSGKADQGLIKDMTDQILAEDTFAKDAGNKLYHYRHGAYRPDGEEYVQKQFQTILEETGNTKMWSTHRAREVVAYIAIQAPRLRETPPLDILNLKNGLFDIKNGTLLPHTPTHLSSIQLPVQYNPEATCPAWDQFIQEVFPEDTQALGYEIPAYLMRPDNSQQKAVLFYGEGENGKSTYLRGLTGFIGEHNICAVNLHRLEDDKFAAQRLVGKLACIVSDLPSAHLSGSSVFKAITGSDPIEAERKFQDSFLFTPFARLVFSTNHFPQSKDSSQAFFRRWVVIPFTLAISPDKRITREVLDARLGAPHELSGVLNKALAAHSAMKLRKGFTQSESLQAAHQEFREQTDPLATWLDRTTVMVPQGFLTKKDFLIKYNAWSEEQGRPPITAHAFTKAIRRLRPGLKEVQKTVRGNVERGFLGLQWVSSSQVSSPVHTFHNFSPFIHREEEGVDKSINRGKVVKDVKSGEAQPSDLFHDPEEVDPWN